MNRPFWLMYPPKKYYAFRRQTLINWIDRHSHMIWEQGQSNCSYCNRTGDELWWWLPTCRAHNWHIHAGLHQYPPGSMNNPYRKKD